MKIICLFGFLFPFELLETESIDHALSFGWNKIPTLSNFPKHQATGKWDEDISIDGTLVVESVNRLYFFEEMAKLKTPIRFTIPTGESYFVVITKLTRSKKEFTHSGKFTRQDYNITMERYFDEV